MTDSSYGSPTPPTGQAPGPRPPVDASAAGGPPPPPPPYFPGYYPPPDAGKRGGSGGAVRRVLMGVLTSVVLISLLLNVYLGFIVSSMLGGDLREEVFAEGDVERRIVILPIEGGIDAAMADFSRKAWRHLGDDPPAAVVMRVNSGGGGISASDEMLQHLKAFKAEHPDVPVVASFGPVAASGGYYVAADADAIYAERTSITGSIGVIAQLLTFEGTLDKIGVEPVTIVATGSPRKDVANNLFRDWSEEDRVVVKDLLNSAYEVFVGVVYDGRQAALGAAAPTLDEVRDMASGVVYTAEQAQSIKLIDEVGYLNDAVDRAGQLAGLTAGDEPRVTRIVQPVPFSFASLLTGQAPRRPIAALPDTPDALRSWVNELGELRLEYRMALP